MRKIRPITARRARPLRFGALLLLALSWAVPASAQERGSNKAAAEALFQQGKTLYQSGDYEQACAKFAASQELDAGFGTLMNLGECYEKRKMTASAWATFKEAASLAHSQGQSEREASARDRAAALEARLSTLMVHAADEVATLPGLDIRLNGTPLPRAVWGSPVPVDPGVQHLVLNAPGYKPFTRDVTVTEEGAATRIDVPALERDGAVTSSDERKLAAPPPNAAPVSAAPASSVPDQHRGNAQRSVGFVAGGVGIAAVVVGSVFGLRAIAKNSDSKELCRTDTLCSSEGKSKRDDALSAARVSTVAFVAGGALLAAGVTLVLTAPRHAAGERAAAPGRGVRRLELGSTFGRERALLELRGAW